ncbi:MAG: class I SAM-dependent methyltransferase, partial [Acidobacteria bacterium]|nr:class I SAM-dependent methyltransferase [Acidobacteriota bacterium]
MTAKLYGREYFEGGENGGYVDYIADSPLHIRNALSRLALLQRHSRGHAGTLVDVGCGPGLFLSVARKNGWRGKGVDISSFAADTARERFGVEVHRDLEKFCQDRREDLDSATFFQSLEHMPRPDLAIQAVHGALRSGGLLLIETWDRTSLVARLCSSHWAQITPPSV